MYSTEASPVPAPSDPLLPHFSPQDGRACPSLESYLELRVQGLSVRCQALGRLGVDGAAEDTFSCRVRLLGNAMSRPPLQVRGGGR